MAGGDGGKWSILVRVFVCQFLVSLCVYIYAIVYHFLRAFMDACNYENYWDSMGCRDRDFYTLRIPFHNTDMSSYSVLKILTWHSFSLTGSIRSQYVHHIFFFFLLIFGVRLVVNI